MARTPIPKSPKLFQAATGHYFTHFPSVNRRGAPTLGSIPLKTKIKSEAQALHAEKVDGGEVARLMEQAKRNVGKPKPNGAEPKKRKAIKVVVPPKDSRLHAQLRLVTTQLHALALAVEQLNEELG